MLVLKVTNDEYVEEYIEVYSYDIFGNIVSTSINNNVRYKYTYDADGSLVYFADLQNNIHDSYCYDEYGFAVKYTFDSSGKIEKKDKGRFCVLTNSYLRKDIEPSPVLFVMYLYYY